ncbi:MAG: sigma-70 family RNA polymerase sigma factor [Bryobacterales bacterium]|nr:sigma-70 family RNA polymerase sigma factor [Bryobacterales bacterium]
MSRFRTKYPPRPLRFLHCPTGGKEARSRHTGKANPLTPSISRIHDADLELAAAVLKRDRKATARLIELHADAVHRYVWRRLTPKVDLVDDIVQDVFVAAWRGLPGYSGEASLQTWLVSIARNKVEDYYRRTLAAPLESLEQDEDAPLLASSVNLDANLEQSRQEERAAKILSGIPYEYATALRWRYWEGRTAREMAAATGRTEKAVERLLARARAKFKSRWEETA